jgi:glycosyltransferase involved in cell wall biosynthesis
MRVFMMDLLATVPYYTAYLSRALLARGVDVSVGSITYYLDLDCFRSRGLRLQPGFMDVVGRYPSLPRAVRRIAKLAETLLNLAALSVRFLLRPPDILHVQYLPMLQSRIPVDLLFVRLVHARGARVVLTVHDLLPHDTAEQYREKFLQLYGSMDALVCHSTHIRTRLIEEFKVTPERIHVIPHGPLFYDLPEQTDAPLRTRYGIAPRQQIVLWQGLIFPYKGVDVLLQAWHAVEQQSHEGTLVIVGTGAPDLLEQIRVEVARLSLQRVVLDLQYISSEDLVAMYRAASVVVYPYRNITTSGALATGLALGKAIVASDLPVFRELLTDEQQALLTPPGDAAALANALARLLQDAALRERLGAAVRAMNFGDASWDNIADATETMYCQTLVQ